MPSSVIEHRCLIISPSDVPEERAAIVDVIQRWNASVGASMSVRVEPVRWETHTHPDLSTPPQDAINTQIVDESDLGIAVFWTKLGSPTRDHESGSVEEIERLIQANKKVLLFQSAKPIAPTAIDPDQHQRLRAKFDQFKKQGLFHTFATISELREQVSAALTRVVASAVTRQPIDSGLDTAPRPDVRARTAIVVAHPTMPGQPSMALKVSAANHSTRAVFIAQVTLKLATGSGLFPAQDAFTRQLNGRYRLEAGDCYDFHIHPNVLWTSDVDPTSIICAEVLDNIGRVFSSDPEQTQKDIAALVARNPSRT